MINYSLIEKEIIDKKAWVYAKDEKIVNKTLIKMLLVYKDAFLNFLEKNNKKIYSFLESNKKENLKWTETDLITNFEISNLINFLISGSQLIDEKGNLKIKNFYKYKVINDQKRIDKINEVLNLLENEWNWNEIKKIYNNLQFILAFNENLDLRCDYYKKYLWEVIKEEPMEEKDYRVDIFQKLFPKNQLKTNQYNI